MRVRQLRHAVLLSIILCWAAHATFASDADKPINPFRRRTDRWKGEAVPCKLFFSNGKKLEGLCALTHGKGFKIFDRAKSEYREVPLKLVAEVKCEIEKEWMEKMWRWKEEGSDVKVYTGKAYPVRKYVHTIKLVTGEVIKGDMAGVIYFLPKDAKKRKKFEYHKRNKGKIGQTLKDMVYFSRIVFEQKGAKSDAGHHL